MSTQVVVPPAATHEMGVRRGARPALVAAMRGLAALVVVVATTLAGVGWLYLLRHAGVVDAGPHVREALPLQRLAGGDAQPVLRLAAAWLPAGVFGGFALHAVGFRRRAARAALLAAGCAILLLAAGAAADAVTANDPLGRHLAEQPARAATWIAAALLALGAALR